MNWFSKEFYIFGRFSRKNRGFDPQISREVHNSGHRKNQKRKFRGRKNRGYGVPMKFLRRLWILSITKMLC